MYMRLSEPSNDKGVKYGEEWVLLIFTVVQEIAYKYVIISEFNSLQYNPEFWQP